MGKEVKLKPFQKSEKAKEKEEVKKEIIQKPLIKEEAHKTPQDAEGLKKVLSQEEMNIDNAKRLRKTLRGIQNQDLIGYIILFNDHKTKRVGVLSSIDPAVSQFVALAHGGYVDQYDQIINQCITTRTIGNMKQARPIVPTVQELPAPPNQLTEGDEERKESDDSNGK